MIPQLKLSDNFDIVKIAVIIAIILMSVVPMGVEWLKARQENKKKQAALAE